MDFVGLGEPQEEVAQPRRPEHEIGAELARLIRAPAAVRGIALAVFGGEDAELPGFGGPLAVAGYPGKLDEKLAVAGESVALTGIAPYVSRRVGRLAAAKRPFPARAVVCDFVRSAEKETYTGRAVAPLEFGRFDIFRVRRPTNSVLGIDGVRLEPSGGAERAVTEAFVVGKSI